MKKEQVMIAVVILFVVLVVLIKSMGNPFVTMNSSVGTQEKEKVAIFLVALHDNGEKGEEIGCGDSLVPIRYEVMKGEANGTIALEVLLKMKEQTHKESGLYNALANSTLKIARIDKKTSSSNDYDIYLEGEIALGGVCDAPRVEEQLKATALKNPHVSKAQFYLNGIPLHEALSQK